jgi:hypothetical protein
LTNAKYALFALPLVAILIGFSAFSTSFQSELSEVPSVADRSTVTGHVILQVFDTSTGELKYKIENHNLVVDVGLDEISQATFGVGGAGSTFFDFIEIGTGTTAPTATDTIIETSACARIQDASPDSNSGVSGETSTSVISSFDGATCAGAITEAGIFNGLAGGQLLARSTFGAVTIASGDTLNVNYTITIT